MADDSSTGGRDNPFGAPAFDLTRFLENLSVPGVDVSSLLEREQRNINAVREANEAVMEGWQKLASRQAELFSESMSQWQAAMEHTLSNQQHSPEAQAELMRRGFERALDNMREMAEIAADSQAKAFDIIRQRLEENIGAYFNRGKRQDE